MKNSKRVIAVILSIIMCAALLAACNNSTPQTGGSPSQPSASAPASPTEGAQNAKELTMVMGNTALGALNPFQAASNSTPANHTFVMIYDTLLTSLGEGKYGPNLATEWKTDDYKTFTFKLRDDVYFHNGEHFTANDVAYTIKYAVEKGGGIL